GRPPPLAGARQKPPLVKGTGMAAPKQTPPQSRWLAPDGPACLVVKARLNPVAGLGRFQPAGFPEVGHVIYDAPGGDAPQDKVKVCIVDSPASMANPLESVCMAGPNDTDLHAELQGLPHVVCVTDRSHAVVDGKVVVDPNDPKDRVVATSLTEGHRLASD